MDSWQWIVDSDWFWGIYYTEVVCFSCKSYYTEIHGGFTEWHGVVYIFLSVSSCLLRALGARIVHRDTQSLHRVARSIYCPVGATS